MRNARIRSGTACAEALLQTSLLVGCAAHQRATPEQVALWSRERFSECLLQEIKDGRLRFEGGDGTSFANVIVTVSASGTV